MPILYYPRCLGLTPGCAAWPIAWLPRGTRPLRYRYLPALLLIWSWPTTPPIWLKDATTSEQILADVAAAVSWFRPRYPQAAIHVVGFCFGGHTAFLAATLPGVEHAFDFYGAGVSRMRPGGGEPSLALLPEIKARLTCVFGTTDPLIPSEDREAIGAALSKVDSAGQRLRVVESVGADHGFMCEARGAFNPQASAQGWRLLLAGDAEA